MTSLPPIEMERALLRGKLLLLAFGMLFIPSFSLFSGSSLRFIFYLFPFVSLLFWLLTSQHKRMVTDMRFVAALAIYAILPLIGVFMQVETINKETWINTFRPIFYLLAFVPFMEFTRKSVHWLIIIFALTTLCMWFTGVGTTRGSVDLEDSKGLLESGLAFPLGGIFIYCVVYREKLWGLITFILFFIAFKRIAIAAAFAVLGLIAFGAIVHYLIPRFPKRAIANIILLCTLIGMVLLNLNYAAFFETLLFLMDSNKSLHDITMGRINEFGILYQQYGDQPIANLLFGNGPGDATRKLVEITIDYPLQVHNSFLLYFYDFGIIGFALLLLAFYLIFSRNSFGIYLMTYNIIIMVVDNTFIHHYHQVTYFVLMSAVHYHHRYSPAVTKPTEPHSHA